MEPKMGIKSIVASQPNLGLNLTIRLMLMMTNEISTNNISTRPKMKYKSLTYLQR